MGKKKFIDKKKAATFTLIFRESAADDPPSSSDRQFTRIDGGYSYIPGFSEDDPRVQASGEEDWDENNASDDGHDSRFDDADDSEIEEGEPVLRPSTKPSSNAFVKERAGDLQENVRRELIELGFPDDGYDYNQHLRRIGATGVGAAFVPSSRAADPLGVDLKAYDASKVKVEVAGESGDAVDDGIIELVSSCTRPVRKPLSKEGVLDADIIAALENSDGSQFDSADELEDEFVVFASEVIDEATTSERSKEARECRRHNLEEELDAELDDDEEDDEFRELPERPQKERPKRLLDERFERLALSEYDDFDVGDLDEDDLARGHTNISSFSSLLEDCLNGEDFCSEKYETVAEASRTAALDCTGDIDHIRDKTANVNMVANKGMDDAVVKKTLELGGCESEEEVVVAVVESEDEADQWDCETVVSTYSNLDNHPAKISAPGRSRVIPRFQELEKSKIIRIGGRQHLPLDYLPLKSVESNQDGKPAKKEAVSSAKVSRPRGSESLEEKKVRKAAIKEQRKEARVAKKTLKLFYREDSHRAQHGAATMGPNAIHLP